MTGLPPALWAEALKTRRSGALWISALGISFAPLVGGLFMMILKDPDWALRLGLITTKAQIITAGTADWPTFFGLLSQAIAVGGFMLFGLLEVWVFGREYSDRTIKDLLALPTSRAAIVAAKFIVAAVWSFLLAVVVYGIGLGVGFVVGLPGWSTELAWEAGVRLASTAGLTIALVTPFAWAASAGRGYLPPIGFMFVLLVLSQIVAALGWGEVFPWSVPALSSGVAGPAGQGLGVVSYGLVVLVGILGVAGTLAWWRFADMS